MNRTVIIGPLKHSLW